MAADLRSSLFGDEVQVEGPEIRFRATCALGWSLLERLPELRSISDSLEVHWLDWILRIEIEVRRVLEQFTSKHAGDWPEHITNALRFLAEQPDVRSFNSIAAFLKQVGEDVKHPDALDPALQLSCFNKRGFDLASRMFSSREWSTDFVRDRWRLGRPAAWSFRADECGSFQPVTSSSNDQIQLRVDTRTFDLKNAVVSYLTLDFQMMHEYVSHFLPVWHSGNTLEEEYLLATTFLFYRAERRPRDGIHVGIVPEPVDFLT